MFKSIPKNLSLARFSNLARHLLLELCLCEDPVRDPALDRALKSPAFYIGSLGSRRTHARRVARLKELGHSDAAIARIKGPVGLDLGAVTAPEIAVAILAEFVAARRNGALAPKVAERAAA